MGFLKQNEPEAKKERMLFLFLLLLLLFCWYQGVLKPVHRRIGEADPKALEAELRKEQEKEIKFHLMQEEIEKNRVQQTPVVPSYNHFKEEIEELNRIFSSAYRYDFHFSEPQAEGMQVRRNAAITIQAANYDTAVSMLRALSQGAYRVSLQDVSISSEASHAEDIKEGAVLVSFQLTFYETLYDSDTEEGLNGLEKERKTLEKSEASAHLELEK